VATRLIAARPMAGPPIAARRARGRRTVAGAARRLARLAIAAIVAAGCAGPAYAPTYPPTGSTPQPATSVETGAARSAVVAALTAAGLQAGDADQPYQPQEGPWFAAAPRSTIEVTIPGEGTPRFVVVYAFDSPADAATAAADQASYVSHGVGLAYFPSDSRFTIRVLGATAIFFTWSPGNADPRTQEIETALDTIGTAVTIPR